MKIGWKPKSKLEESGGEGEGTLGGAGNGFNLG